MTMIKRHDRLDLYGRVSRKASAQLTRDYSTSFSKAIRVLGPNIRDAVYAVYGFVRLVDEVVDSFAGYDQRSLFEDVKKQTHDALENRISTNLVLHAFQEAFHRYEMSRKHVDQFFASMERDLDQQQYTQTEYSEYINGSAEVVGLMCLKIFVRGDDDMYQKLRPAAIRLGAAFQKVNFLRDIQEDYEQLGRTYFPAVDILNLDQDQKRAIEVEISLDLEEAYKGIVQLPRDSRFGVYLAYCYYRQLLVSIQKVPSNQLIRRRIRVPDFRKAVLWATSFTRHYFNLI